MATDALQTFVGPRILIKFAGAWEQAQAYEYMTAVYDSAYQSWISKCDVPADSPLVEGNYWMKWSDPNAQFQLLQQTVQTFDQRITNNANEIENTNTALANLESTTDEKITNNANEIENTNTALANLESTIDEKKSVILAFGDSFGDQEGEWADLISKAIGKTLDNFCLAGATWPFESKVTEAAAKYSTAESREKIAFIIAYGGINSTVYNPITSIGPITSFITSINNAFPGIPLYIAPLNNCSPYNTTYPNAFRNTLLSAPFVYRELRNFVGNFILLENSYYFNTGDNDLWNTDLLHPNAKGSATIANNMLSAMFGNNDMYQGLEYIGENENVTFESQGFITAKGIMLPRMRIANISTSIVYFKGCGFFVANRVPITWFDYSNENTFTVHNDDNYPLVYSSDTYNQIAVNFNGISFDSGHWAVIPEQFIPFGVPVLKS